VKVFISYRRGDAVALAGRLYDRLEAQLGAGSVFMDQEGIPVGSDFAATIFDQIADCDAMLVLIGPQWLDLLATERGATTDFVVEEVARALDRKIPVIPVLLGDTQMPSGSDLPDQIRALVERQALRLEPGERFSADVERMMKAPPFAAAAKGSLSRRIRKWFAG
jgi:hypothetical protein